MQASRVISSSFRRIAVAERCGPAVSKCSMGAFYHTASSVNRSSIVATRFAMGAQNVMFSVVADSMDISAKKNGVFAEGLVAVAGEIAVGAPLYKMDSSATAVAATPAAAKAAPAAPAAAKAAVPAASKLMTVPVPIMGESITFGVLSGWAGNAIKEPAVADVNPQPAVFALQISGRDNPRDRAGNDKAKLKVRAHRSGNRRLKRSGADIVDAGAVGVQKRSIPLSSYTLDMALTLAKARVAEYESQHKPSPVPASARLHTAAFLHRLEMEASLTYTILKRHHTQQRYHFKNEAMTRILVNEILLSAIHLEGGHCTYCVEEGMASEAARGRPDYHIFYRYLEVLVVEAKGPGSMVESSLGQLIAGMMLGREKSAREMEVELRICTERAGALMETVPSYGVLTTGTSWVFVKLWTDGGSRRVLVSRELRSESLLYSTKEEAIRDLKRVQVALAAIMDAQVSALTMAEKHAALK